jgi:hypothetical protein
MPKVLKRIGIGLMLFVGLLVVIVAATVVVAGLLYRAKERERTPAGLPRISSLYLTMSDGTRIAVEVALPKDLRPGQKIPVLIKGTPYWRSPQLTFPGAAQKDAPVPRASTVITVCRAWAAARPGGRAFRMNSRPAEKT